MAEPNREIPETDLRACLQRTIDLVCEDAARIELWACALNGFAQPVPDYIPGDKYLSWPRPNQRRIRAVWEPFGRLKLCPAAAIEIP